MYSIRIYLYLFQGVIDGAPSSGDGVQAQELAAKIAENAELHMKVQ